MAIVGTQNTTQGILDLVGSVQTSLPGIPGNVGAYWGSLALNFSSVWLPIVERSLNGRSLVLLGHSLGAAVVEVLAALWQPLLPSTPLVVFTFGACRPGDPIFAAAVSELVHRFENDGDPIVAIPPPVWAGYGSIWPLSGPPPLSVYVHPGQASTVYEDGSVVSGSNPMSTVAAASALSSGQVVPHLALEYARRLQIKLPPEDYTREISQYASPDELVPQLQFLSGKDLQMSTPSVLTATTTPLKVTLFYNYGTGNLPGINRPSAGITESFWSLNSSAVLRQVTIPDYVQARMGIAVDLFSFLYARISNLNAAQVVDFVTPSTVKQTNGILSTTGKLASSRGAFDTSAILLRIKLTGGPSAQPFFARFRCYPG